MVARLEAHRAGEYTTMCLFLTGEKIASRVTTRSISENAILYHSTI